VRVKVPPHDVLVTVVFNVVGAVHPAGMSSLTRDQFAKAWLAVKVNANEFVLPALTLEGATVIVPVGTTSIVELAALLVLCFVSPPYAIEVIVLLPEVVTVRVAEQLLDAPVPPDKLQLVAPVTPAGSDQETVPVGML
jgi:hypothetical protein